MDDFDKKIRQKYEADFDSNFHESDWRAYGLMKAQKKKKKRRALLWLVLVPVILTSAIQVFSLGLFDKDEVVNTIDLGEDAEVVENMTPFHRQEASIKSIEGALLTSEIEEEQRDYNVIQSSKEKSALDPVNNSETEIFNTSREERSASQDPRKDHFVLDDSPAMQDYKTFIEDESERGKEESFDGLPRISISDLVGGDPKIEMKLNYEESKAKNRFLPTDVLLRYSVGYSHTPQKVVLDDVANFDDFSLILGTQTRFRYMLNIHLQEISYRIESKQPESGIANIAAPRESVSLAQASAETETLYSGLGLQYQTYRSPSLVHYLGISYGFETILRKKIEYQFEGENEEDSETITLTDSDRKFVWNKPKVSTGLEFNLYNFVGFAELSYINTFNGSEAILPKMVHGSIGVGYKF